MSKISFIGLGVMGYPMAGHLASADYDVSVYNRTNSVAQNWVDQHGGRCFPTPKLAVAEADFVFICVGNDDDLRSVVYGDDGVIAGMKQGAFLVDHTSASPTLARTIYSDSSKAGLVFYDAPVSGGQQGAENGQLTIMCGGNAEDFAPLKKIMACYAKFSQLMGGPGSGQLAKVANQICIGGLVQSLSEALLFANSAGLDLDKLIETISKGAAGSWQMENRYRTMADGEYQHGFAVDWMRKDLNIAKNEAAALNIDLPLTKLIDDYYAEVQALGGGRWDTSSLLYRLNALQAKTIS